MDGHKERATPPSHDQVTGALGDNGGLLRAIASVITDAIFVKDSLGRYIWINAAGAQYLGRPAEEVIGKDDRLLFSHEDAQRIMGIDQRILDSGESHTYEATATASGVTRTYLVTNGVWLNDDGRAAGTVGIARDITDQKNIETALINSTGRYRTLVELAPDVVYRIDADGMLIDLSPAFSRVTGWDASEWLGKSFAGLVHPDDRELALERFNQILQGDSPPPYEIRIGSKSGEYLVSEFRSTPLLTNGNPIGAVGVARDVTERRRIERDLQQSRDQLATILTSIAEGIVVQDATGRLLYANDAAARIAGFRSGAEMTQVSVADLVARLEILDQFGNPFPLDKMPGRLALNGEHPPAALTLFRMQGTGEERWQRIHAAPVFNQAGEVQFAVNIVTDITESKHAEETLRSRARQQAAVAELGQVALSDNNLEGLMNNAVATVAETLEVEYAKVLELLPRGESLLLKAGIGWQEGLVGIGTVGADTDSQAGYTLLSNGPVIVHDLRNETRFSGPPLLHDHHVRSGMSTIIKGRGAPYGVLGAHTTRLHTFSEDDIHFLQAVANILAAAIERAQAEKRVTVQSNVSSVIAEGASVEEAAPRILEAIGDCFGWELGSLWIVDPGEQVLRCRGIWQSPSIDAESFEDATRRFTIQHGVGLPGRVWDSGEAIAIPDVLPEANFQRVVEAANAGLHGAFAFPILSSSRTSGVIEFFSQAVRHPEPDMLETVATLGNQIGQFIDRKAAETKLEESEELKSSILASAIDAIVTMDHEGRIIEFNPSAEATFGYTAEEAVGRELAGLLIPPPLQDRHRQGLKRYIATGEGQIIGKRIEVTAVRADGEEFPAELAITLISRDGPPTFTGFLRDITRRRQAEAALRQSEASEKRAAQENAAVAEIGRTISSAPDIQSVFERFAEQVRDLIPLDRMALGIVDQSQPLITNRYVWGRSIPGQDPGTPLQLAGSIAEHLINTRLSVLIQGKDIEGFDDRFPGTPLGDFASIIGVPLVSRGIVLACLVIRSAAEDAYSAHDLALCERIGVQITGAIANASLYEERSRAEASQRFLSNAGSLLASSLDYQATLEEVVKLAVPAHADWCAVDMLQEEGSIHRLAVAHADASKVEMVYELGRRHPQGESSPLYQVLHTGVPTMSSHISPAQAEGIALDENHLQILRHLAPRSAMIVPLKARDRVLGALTFVTAESGRRYGEADLALAGELARRCAIAVDNALLYQEERRTARQLHTINQLITRMSSILALDELLPYTVRLLRRTFGYDVAAIWVKQRYMDVLALATYDTGGQIKAKPRNAASGHEIAIGEQSIIGTVAATGAGILANDVGKDDRYRVTAGWNNIRSQIALPIKLGSEIHGVLDIRSTQPGAFGNSDQFTVEAVAKQLAVAMENASLLQRTRELGVLEERNRLAREIHDSIAQGLAGILWQLNSVEAQIKDMEATPEALSALSEVQDLARESLKEARRSVKDLRAAPLEFSTLVKAMEEIVKRTGRERGITCHFQADGSNESLPPAVETAIFRICQETLSNISKHASAKTVHATVLFSPDEFCMTISDDGRGFKFNTADYGHSHYGLKGMRERAKLIGGSFNVKSAPGEGTTVTLTVPLAVAAPE